MTHSLSSSSTCTVVFFSWQFMVRFTNLTGNYIKYETDLVWSLFYEFFVVMMVYF